MKVTFTIEDLPDGDVLLQTDPPMADLMLQALAGRSTAAAALALTACQHILQQLAALQPGDAVESAAPPEALH